MPPPPLNFPAMPAGLSVEVIAKVHCDIHCMRYFFTVLTVAHIGGTAQHYFVVCLVYDVVVKKFTFAVSSADELLVLFYRFVYSDTANITVDNALPLMYAAKKYLVTGLVKECETVVEKALSKDTVCTVLEQSISLHEDELKKKCLRFICRNTCRVFKRKYFLRLSRDALQEIICLDSLALPSERRIYEYCVKWAKYQLLKRGNKCPSDEEIRKKLGNVLYSIRFLTMTQKDFAELTAQSAILTAEEKHEVYVYMTLGTKLESSKFVETERRRMGGIALNRFNQINRRHTDDSRWTCDGKTDAIAFASTVDMYLTGIGLYGGRSASAHDVTVRVLKGNKTLSTLITQMSSDGSQDPIKMELDNPVYVHANTRYTVAVVMKGHKTWYGADGIAVCHFPESGSIAFDRSEMCTNGSNVHAGQIPQLFCLEY